MRLARVLDTASDVDGPAFKRSGIGVNNGGTVYHFNKNVLVERKLDNKTRLLLC